MAQVIALPTVAGFIDQADSVEDMGGGMIVIDPLLDDWIDTDHDDDMRLAA